MSLAPVQFEGQALDLYHSLAMKSYDFLVLNEICDWIESGATPPPKVVQNPRGIPESFGAPFVRRGYLYGVIWVLEDETPVILEIKKTRE